MKLSLDRVNFSYNDTSVLRDLNVTFEPGTLYAIVGNSGAGKSTLLALLAGLDVPTSGTIRAGEDDIAIRGYSHHRRTTVALVFQNYNLIDYLTPLENVKLVNPHATIDSLTRLGLSSEEATRNVLKLSGGQQQRVAIARALAANTPIILADEPTGNLDGDTAADMVKILQDLAHTEGKCVIVVTHSPELARQADVVLRLKKGRLIKD